eukprot:gene4661-6549_t
MDSILLTNDNNITSNRGNGGGRKNTHLISEELMFIFAILSILSIIMGQTNSVRYLGIIGALTSGWRCYEMSQLTAKSNRII